MDVWQIIWNTVRAEFPIPDVENVVRLFLRLGLAALLGGMLGFEREKKGKAAGIRTHMLVAMGAALFVLIPQQAGATSADLSRVFQGLVTGIGFLGAGTILKVVKDEREHPQGLTTAAGIWLTAAIGAASGIGYEVTAVLSTVLALLIFSCMPRVANT